MHKNKVMEIRGKKRKKKTKKEENVTTNTKQTTQQHYFYTSIMTQSYIKQSRNKKDVRLKAHTGNKVEFRRQ